MAKSGIVRYANYKNTAGGGAKNKRKRKLNIIRTEEAIQLRLRTQALEKQKMLEKAKYLREAREWSERYEF